MSPVGYDRIITMSERGSGEMRTWTRKEGKGNTEKIRLGSDKEMKKNTSSSSGHESNHRSDRFAM